MITLQKEEEMIREAAATFPATFELRAFPGDTFRVSLSASYVADGRVVIYVERHVANEWCDFAKGTPAELMAQIKRGGT